MLPNPLVEIAQIDAGTGVGLDLRSFEWILHGRQDGSCLPDRKVEYTTINTYVGVALNPISWDRILDGVQLVSRPLFY